MKIPSRETQTARALHTVDQQTGAVIAPIHPSTTYERDGDNQLIGEMDYRRPAGPNERKAAKIIAMLEGAADARVFASGMAAIAAVIDTVPTGGHVVAQTQMYYGAKALMQRAAEKNRITLDLVKPGDLAALNAACRPGTDLVWAESPANPDWSIVDLAATARIAHTAGARLGVDSTCAPPCTTQCLSLGADIVMHSATKYLNGHSDVLAGTLATKTMDQRWADIGTYHDKTGATPGAFETWLLIRGMRTLFVRFERQSATALHLAQALQGSPALSGVLYPGLALHPGHAIAARQMSNGFGGMLSLRLAGGFDAARRMAANTQLFIQATSLGGVESLIEHRQPVEGPDTTVPGDLVRLSCGLESADDLLADLRQALEGE
jgi:cystathionine gamma-synthase